MWGNISTEASYQLNFNVGFSTTRSDVLVHLAQWQYWWWFWFALVWSFYYLIMLRVIRFRVLKMKPKISTSYRPHGKWGDFLACIIPMIWCINILSNSNFILRLIEWQNESSLFTVRVRARQWYWIYKFELKTITDILTAPKNIGNNKWQINTFGDLQTTDDYLHILQLRAQNRWVKKYWSDILSKSAKSKKYHLISPQENFSLNSLAPKIDLNNVLLNSSNEINYFNYSNNYFKNNINFFKFSDLDTFNKIPFNQDTSFKLNNLFFLNTLKKKNQYINGIYSNIFNNNNNINYLYPDYIESTRWNKRGLGVKSPLRLIKNPNLTTLDFNDSNFLLKFRFNLNKDNTIEDKQFSHNPYLVLKQKKYKKKKTIPLKTKYFLDENGNKTRKIKYSGYPILIDNKIFDKNIEDPNIQYRMVKKAKLRHDLIPVTLARRILRTKKTLVLPAHINVTLITNSYDIVHSWFIPGLGIKLDCVPGRSTHHTFFIDNVGFYYGQCAEICGRYHHHMPIRVCALPFEHFLVWWHNFGLPKLLFSTSQKRYETYYAFRKYVW